MTIRKTLLASLAVLALAAHPALAGNGNGGGHGNGNGGGNAGSNGNSGNHGKSGSAPGQVAKADDTTVDTTTTATPDSSTNGNIHSKLGRLNSLQRNINAYLNSKSPKFAAIQAFVTQSAKAKVAAAAAAAAAAQVAADQAALNALNTQLATLQGTDQSKMTPEQKAALAQQITDVQNQITAEQATLAADTTAAAQAQAAATAAAVGTDQASLTAALQTMANKPVDAQVTAWAQGVLAGKINAEAAMMSP